MFVLESMQYTICVLLPVFFTLKTKNQIVSSQQVVFTLIQVIHIPRPQVLPQRKNLSAIIETYRYTIFYHYGQKRQG